MIGASGATFALVGYAVAANPLASGVSDRMSLRAGVVAVGVAALLLAVLFGGAGGALLAHVVGALAGLVAGWGRLLAVAPRTER